MIPIYGAVRPISTWVGMLFPIPMEGSFSHRVVKFPVNRRYKPPRRGGLHASPANSRSNRRMSAKKGSVLQFARARPRGTVGGFHGLKVGLELAICSFRICVPVRDAQNQDLRPLIGAVQTFHGSLVTLQNRRVPDAQRPELTDLAGMLLLPGTMTCKGPSIAPRGPPYFASVTRMVLSLNCMQSKPPGQFEAGKDGWSVCHVGSSSEISREVKASARE